MAYWAYFANCNNFVTGQAGGVYLARDFSVDGPMPHWENISDGLPNTDILQMRHDGVEGAQVQYVRLSDHSVWRRDIRKNNGRWTKIIDRDQALELAGGGDPAYGYAIPWIAPHMTQAGGICLYFGAVLSILDYPTWQASAYIIRSRDYGDTWEVIKIPDEMLHVFNSTPITSNFLWLWPRFGAVEWTCHEWDVDELMWISLNTGIVSQLKGFYYWPQGPKSGGDGRSPWGETYLGEPMGVSGWFAGPVLDPTLDYLESSYNAVMPKGYYISSGTADSYYPKVIQEGEVHLDGEKHDGIIVLETITQDDGAALQVSDGGYTSRNDNLWMSALNSGHHRIIWNQKLFSTSDRWVNFESVDIDTSPANYLANLTALPDNDTPVLIARRSGSNLLSNDQPFVYALENENSETLIPRGGDHCGESPFTDSIPSNGGAPALNGFFVVGEPRRVGVYVYSVEFGDVGTAQGHYLHGDQAVWDVDNQPEEHAKDIADNLPVYHLPPPTAEGDMLVAALVDGHLVWTISSGAVVVPGETLTDDNADILIDDVGSVLTEG